MGNVDTTEINAPPDHGTDEFEVGQTVDFRITAANEGPSLASGITITETLPQGLQYISHDGQDWELDSQDPDPSTGEDVTEMTFTYTGELEAGETTPGLALAAKVTVDVANTDEVTNTACVGTTEENAAEEPCASDDVPIVPIADLTVEKTVQTPAADISAGRELTWMITAANAGPSASMSTDADPILVRDTLPDGVAGVLADPSTEEWTATTSNPGGWQQAAAGDEITWTFTGGEFTAGAEHEIELTVMLDSGWHDAEITNTAAITPGETRDPDDSNNSDDVTVTPGDGTGLEIWKTRVVSDGGEWVPANTLDPIPAFNPGTPVRYRITVANTGPADARDVEVVDAIPTGLTNPRLEEGGPEWTLTGVDTCDDAIETGAADCAAVAYGEVLAVGSSQAAGFVVTFDTDPALDVADPVVNLAQARATNVPEGDWPEAEDSTDSSAYADLAITKTADRGEVSAGEQVGFTLVVSNVGPSSAAGPVQVTDSLPAGMTYVEGSVEISLNDAAPAPLEPQTAVGETGETLTWEVTDAAGSLAPDDTVTLTLAAQVSEVTYAPEGLVNVATVASPDDENPLNDEDSAAVIVGPKAELAITKTAVGGFEIGGTGTYEITVENLGPTVDPGPITVVDELPEGLSYVSSDPGAEVDGSVVTWVIEDGLQVGEKRTFTLRVEIAGSAHPSVTNVATATSPTPGPSGEDGGQEVIDEATTPVPEADAAPPTGLAGMGTWALLALALLGLGAGAVAVRRRRA